MNTTQILAVTLLILGLFSLYACIQTFVQTTEITDGTASFESDEQMCATATPEDLAGPTLDAVAAPSVTCNAVTAGVAAGMFTLASVMAWRKRNPMWIAGTAGAGAVAFGMSTMCG